MILDSSKESDRTVVHCALPAGEDVINLCAPDTMRVVYIGVVHSLAKFL